MPRPISKKATKEKLCLTSLQRNSRLQGLGWLKSKVASHPNFKTAYRVFECLTYIEENLESIADKVGRVKLMRHPGNGLAFHLNGFNSAEEVKKNFSDMLAEVHGCLEQIFAIEDQELQQSILSGFISNINDSHVGCMEARLRPAIKFFSLYQSTQCLHLNDLMAEYVSSVDQVITVPSMLEYFADRIEHQLPVVDLNGEIRSLSWEMIKDYVRDTLAVDDIDHQWQQYAKHHADALVLSEGRWQVFYYADEQSASQHLSYIKSMLPAYQSDLAKASVKFHEENGYSFRLLMAQYVAYQDAVAIMQEEFDDKKIEDNTKPTLQARPADDLLETFKTSDVLVKSIRWDKYNFIHDFVEGITPIEGEPRAKKEIRKGKHKAWTVHGGGFWRQADKPSPYPYDAEKTRSKKSKRSQPQSTTLVNPQIQAPVFGHKKDRRNKLAGFMFLADDALISRCYKYDGGTINRPYEHDTKKEAKRYYKRKVLSDHKVLYPNFESFKKGMSGHHDEYNEVMARLRWKEGRSCVAIFSDTFEARCIAQHYALVLKERLRIKTEREGGVWDDRFEVPVLFYMPGKKKHWHRYSLDDQLKDRKQANKIAQNQARAIKVIEGGNPEPLLLVTDICALLSKNSKKDNLGDYLLRLIKSSKDASLLEVLAEKADQHVVLNWLYCLGLNKLENIKKLTLADNKVLEQVFFEALQSIDSGLILPLISMISNVPNFNVNAKNTRGKTALILAVENGDAACVRALLAHPNINVNTCDRYLDKYGYGQTALIVAAKKGDAACVRALLAHPNINVNAKNRDRTALMRAVENRCEDYLSQLLAHRNIYVNRDAYTKEDYKAALLLAAGYRIKAVVEALLTHKNTDVNARDFDGRTALIIAAKNGYATCVRALLAHKTIDVNARDFNGRSALMLAVENGNEACVRALLAQPDIDVNAKCGGCLTALMLAAKDGNEAFVKTILAHPNIDVNAKKEDINIALTLAAENGNAACVRALLAHPDSDLSAGDFLNRNAALKNAKANGHDSCARLLVRHKIVDYLKNLTQRKAEHQPRLPLFASLFGISGFSKTVKIQAATKLLSLMNDTPQDTVLTDNDKAALGNGTLGDIVDFLPKSAKAGIGLR